MRTANKGDIIEKRACGRIPVNVEVRFNCGARTYSGTLTNISEGGMFINMKDVCVPFDLELEILIPFEEHELHISADLSRIVMRPNSRNGLGVEIQNPDKKYMEFLKSFSPGFCNSKHPHI